MARGFRLRISRVIPSFHSCRSKDALPLPGNRVRLASAQKFCLSPINQKPRNIDYPAFSKTRPCSPSPGSVNRQDTRAAAGVPETRKAGIEFGNNLGVLVPEEEENAGGGFRWMEEEKWHVVSRVADQTARRKISISCNPDQSSDTASSCLLDIRPPKSLLNSRRKSVLPRRQRAHSNLSSDSGWFSSEDDETETLFSSRSFSSDSPEFFQNHVIERVQESPTTRRKKQTSALRRKLMPCRVEGKVSESFAVVKRSTDPYRDFKMSMMEMIAEKQMRDTRDLEQLLHCFLSLNAPQHHDVIVRVFTDIWNALLGEPVAENVSR